MKCLASLLLLLATVAFGSDHFSITIYDQNYALVRDVRSFNLPEGQSDIVFADVSRMILDAPVRLNGDGVIALEQTFQYHQLYNDLLLQEQLGKKIELLLDSASVTGTLVGKPGLRESTSTAGFLIQEADGRVRTVRLSDVRNFRYPGLSPEYQIKPTLSFKVQSAAAGAHDIEAAYEVQGLDWNARYLLDLSGDDSSAVFSGWAIITNAAGHAFDHARLTLVSGQPPRAQKRLRVSTDQRIGAVSGLMSDTHVRGGRDQEVVMRDEVSHMAMQAMAIAAPQHEQLFDLQMYTLPLETSLPNGIEKEMNLFPPAAVKTGTSYEYAYWQSPNKVGVYVETVNTDSVGLGVPLPAGTVDIYRMRAGGVPEYVGEDRLGAVAKNEPIRIRVGFAEGLTVDRENLKHETGLGTRMTDFLELHLRNVRDAEVKVDIQERFADKWKILDSSHPWNKTSKQAIEIPVVVPPESDLVVTYTVRTWRSYERR